MKRVLRRAARKDDNEPAVVQALRSVGCFVWDIGTPLDLLVLSPRKTLHLLEVKTPKGKLEPSQKELFTLVGPDAPVHVVRSPMEALQAIGVVP